MMGLKHRSSLLEDNSALSYYSKIMSFIQIPQVKEEHVDVLFVSKETASTSLYEVWWP